MKKRTCEDCGHSYVYNSKCKKGATTRFCSACAKRQARINTKKEMIRCAGGGCRVCGYSRCSDAITFLDAVQPLVQEPKPRNRQEKLEWASHRIVICIRCLKEMECGMLEMKVTDATRVPPWVEFYTDKVQIMDKAIKNNIVLSEPIEIVTDEQQLESIRKAHGRVVSEEKTP